MDHPHLPGTIDLEPPGHFLDPVHEAGDKDGEIVGYVWRHPGPRPGRACSEYLSLRGPRPRYTVEAGTAQAPETLGPAILCRTCGVEGFIKERKWMPA